MRDAVDHHAARAADAFAAIVLELNRLLAFFNQLFVDDIEHLQKGRVGADVVGGVFDEVAIARRGVLSPDVEFQIHL